VTYPTKAEADRWLSHKRADLERGQAVDDRAAGKPLADWRPGDLTFIKGRCRPSTVANYEQALRLRIAPRFGTVAVRRIKATHVEEWLSAMTASGASGSTATPGELVFPNRRGGLRRYRTFRRDSGTPRRARLA
jgi:hypothetical protein